MSDRARWHYVHTLNIYQIALLMEGFDPSELGCGNHHSWSPTVQQKTTALLTALRNAIDEESLTLSKQVYHNEYGAGRDYELSLVHVVDLRKWIERIGLHDTFFRPEMQKLDPVFDCPFDKFYAPKLAAAVDAWKAVTADPRLRRGKSPKQALEAWLRENAARYGLLNNDGGPNATGIEEIAKVANWKPTGGAPATPEVSQPTPGFGKTLGGVPAKPTPGFNWVEGDEIPF